VLAHSQIVTILNELIVGAIRYKLSGGSQEEFRQRSRSEAFDVWERVDGKLAAGIVQAVSVIRNLWGEKPAQKEMLAVNVANTLCSILDTWKHDGDLLYTVARVLAKLSLNEQFRVQINSRKPNIK